MNEINTTLYSIAVTAVALGIINTFSRSSKLHRYIKYTASLIIIASLLSHTINAISSAESAIDELQISIPQKTDSNTTDITKPIIYAIENSISERFNIPSDCFNTELYTINDNNELILEEIHITILNSKYNHLAKNINVYIQTEFGCKAIVNQKI